MKHFGPNSKKNIRRLSVIARNDRKVEKILGDLPVSPTAMEKAKNLGADNAHLRDILANSGVRS